MEKIMGHPGGEAGADAATLKGAAPKRAHTPGPWVRGNTVQHDVLLLGGPAKRYVCHVTIQQAGGGAIAQSMEAEREANARLIAAAPELLEALEGIVAEIEANKELLNGPNPPVQRLLNLVAFANVTARSALQQGDRP
jgi:hypothetical protein